MRTSHVRFWIPGPAFRRVSRELLPKLRRGFQKSVRGDPKFFNYLKTSIPLPKNVCLLCGLEFREMVIDLVSTRKPTGKASEFMP